MPEVLTAEGGTQTEGTVSPNTNCPRLLNNAFIFLLLRFKILISSSLEIDFEINISDKKSRRFDLSEVIFKCIKVL